MLQNIRDKMQGWIAGTIAFIIALTFALWGVQNYLRGGATEAVAKVNGEKITQEQLRIAYEQAKRGEMLRSGSNFSFDQKAQAKLKQDILQQLIEQEVLAQAINKMGLGIGRQQLLATIIGMPIFQVNGHFSPERFQQLLQGLFYSEKSFFDSLTKSRLQMQLEKGIADSAFVLPNEIAAIKKIFRQQRDFGYFMILPERFAKTVTITQDAIKEYYEKHQSDFLLPEKISIQYLELSSDSLKAAGKPTDEQLKQFYQSHIDSFSTPKRWQVTRVLLPLASGTDTKAIAVAKKKIDEIAAKAKGGADLAKIAPGARVTTSWVVASNNISLDLVSQLNKLNIGDISPVFQTKEGYNLIKVLAVQPARTTPYTDVADKVKQGYERQQLTQAFTEANDKLADLVYTNSDSLEPAAKALNLPIQETEMVTSLGSKTGILANPKVIKAAFSDLVLKQRYNSNLIEIISGKVLVLRIKDHIPEKLQPLEQVSQEITQKLQQQASQKAAADFADELLAAIRNGKSEDVLAKQYDLKWQVVIGASYAQSEIASKLVTAAFELTKPKTDKIATTVVDLNGNYAVLRLDKVYEGTVTKEPAKLENMFKFLPEILGRFDYQTMLDNLMKKAKIKITDKVEDRQNG